jgi:hypothetical protein
MTGDHEGLPVLEQRIISAEKLLDDIRDDIKGMRSDQRDLQTQIMDLHKAVLAVGKPQYAVLSGFALVAVMVAGGLWQLAVGPVNDKLVDHKASIDKLEGDYRVLDAKKEDRTDIEGLRADLKSRIDELIQRLKTK